MLRRWSLACVVILCTACAPPAERGGFDNPNPSARIYAIEQALRRDDRAATKDIIEQLDSDDPAVRFLAIGTLRRMWSGEDFGYRYDDPPYLRAEAVQRWVDASAQGRLVASTGAGDG